MADPVSPTGPPYPEDHPRPNYGSKTASGNPRIYNCKQCNRAFTREEHLTRHTLSTHNKLKPFTCGICQRPFSRRDLLLRHAKNLHQGSELAVSRIRKLYRRNESHTNASDDYLDAADTSMDYKGDPHDTPTTRRSIDNSDLMPTPAPPAFVPEAPAISAVIHAPSTASYTPSTPLQAPPPPGYEDPQKKRMKMSVNMLV
ncbi:uncharacterized protein CANTADRAFT_27458, partial [Suhomyces tanzawaensis NRRL Y-17324]